VKKVKKAIVAVFALALIMVFPAVAPVMAIGPDQSFDVGNNPNLTNALGALQNHRGAALGYVLWYESSKGFSGRWLFFDAPEGGGKMKNAIDADIYTLTQGSLDEAALLSGNPTVNENKWIFLSSESSGNQFIFPDTPAYHALYLLGSHGMIWWLFYFGFGHSSTLANNVAAAHPDGVFWNYNYVKMT
jgi:hypothetical protein